MSNNDDIELIEKIKNGDNDALDTLIRKYMGLVRSVVRKCFLVGGDEEDLFQEGLMAILNAVKSYNPQKNINFSSFVTVCVRTRIIDAIRTASRFKHKSLNEASSLSDSDQLDALNITTNFFDPLDSYLEREWMDTFYSNLQALLTEEQNQILQLYFKGYTYKEISEKLKFSNKKVDNSLNAIKNKIRKKRSDFL